MTTAAVAAVLVPPRNMSLSVAVATLEVMVMLEVLERVPVRVEGVWGDWESVTCFTCGLEDVDPESDQEGTYGIDPNEKKKMYNHRCDSIIISNGSIFQ